MTGIDAKIERLLEELRGVGRRVEAREALQRVDYLRRTQLFVDLDAAGVPRSAIAAAARTSESAVSVALHKARQSP